MAAARWRVVVLGILLPYLARISGLFLPGPHWFTDFLGSGLGAIAFLGLCNAVCWGAVLVATIAYVHPRAVWFPALCGFALPAFAYSVLDLRSSSTAAIAFVAAAGGLPDAGRVILPQQNLQLDRAPSRTADVWRPRLASTIRSPATTPRTTIRKCRGGRRAIRAFTLPSPRH